jgi:hypothetical protein
MWDRIYSLKSSDIMRLSGGGQVRGLIHDARVLLAHLLAS